MDDFTGKWDDVAGEGHTAGRFRVAPDHLLDMFVAYSQSGKREFILESKAGAFEHSDVPQFENLDVLTGESSGTHTLTLKLIDITLKDLFSVICLDLVEASSRATTLRGASRIFLGRLNRWAELLKRRRTRGMSLAEQIGLLGELCVLDWLLSYAHIDSSAVIRAWRGPDGDTKDVGLNGVRIEIKAQLSTTRPLLRISSIHQLDCDSRTLIIMLHRFTPADSGVSLSGLRAAVSDRLMFNHDVLQQFQRKLYLTGYDPAAPYISDSYALDEIRIFKVADDFPRLVPANVPSGIIRVAYEVACEAVEKFRISPDGLVEIVRGSH